MRLDHFVLFNNHLTTSKTNNNQNGASMPKSIFPQNCPSIEPNRVFGDGLMVWVRQHQKSDSNLIFGRIRDTGVNYIVEGYDGKCDWVRIPCQNLPTAQLLLHPVVMDRETFNWFKVREVGS